MSIEELRALCESFTQTTGAATAILEPEGNILVATGWKPICTQFHRVHPVSAARCRESDTVLASRLGAGERYNIYRCRNGLVDAAIPITILGEHVANFFAGQFLLEAPDRDFFARRAEELGFDGDAYLRALDGVPVQSEAQTKSMLDFFCRLAQLMGEMGLAHKRLEDTNQELRRHQEHLEDLVRDRTADLNLAQQIARVGSWRWSLRTDEVQWSEGMYRVLGLDPKTSAATHGAFLARVHPAEREGLQRLLREQARKRDPFSTEFRTVEIGDGERIIHLSGEVHCNEDGTPVEMFGTNQDVTEDRRSQRTLAEAKEKAEAANRAKSEFLAGMSHELRTPLNAVLGYTQLLRAGAGLTAQQDSYLEIIGSSGEHLLDLIDSVLEISAIEADRAVVSVSDVDLHRLVHEVHSMVSPRARDKGLSFTVELSPGLPHVVSVDARKLRQILLNLTGNAVKFTEHGAVTLRASTPPGSPADRRLVRFEIADTGPGISPEEAERIFDPFVRGDQSGAKEGVGLGLAICRRFTELLGGRIGAEGRPAGGSLFFVEVPVGTSDSSAETAAGGKRRPVGIEPGQPRHRILVADDLAEGRRLLRELLEPLGFEIREACDGRAAVDACQAWKPELIYMDIRMPGTDGMEATRLIRSAELDGRPRTFIVALTAHAFQEERQAILAAGFDDFVRKPFRVGDIYEALARHLGVRYVYEEDVLPAEASTAAVLSELPAAVLRSLRRASELLDTRECRRIANEIEAAHPGPAAWLRLRIEELRLGELLEELDRLSEGGSRE